MGGDGSAALRARIRELHAATRRRIAVLDDDPTGSQAVHDVDVLTAVDPGLLASALDEPGSVEFVLTNTRSESEATAVARSAELGAELHALAAVLEAPVEIVSRSDSTLRGHVEAELGALELARRRALGAGYDAVLFVPAYLEAGRFTEGDVHYARVGGAAVPVGQTEFARDATFGYRASNLREFLVEVGRGAIRPESVTSLDLDALHAGGGEWVADRLTARDLPHFVVVNATTYDDLEQVALGVALAEGEGRALLHRSGPSFVRALAGIDPIEPLTSADVYADGGPSGGGLVVVGSHVGLTNAQLEMAQARLALASFELDVRSCLDETERARAVGRLGASLAEALATGDALLTTSRELVLGATPDESLALARLVSSTLSEVVRLARSASPSWVLAKGGITSHDVAVHGLGIARARVRGQLLPGMVSVFSPSDAPEEVLGRPFVVFAGNVGDESTLATVIETLQGAR